MMATRALLQSNSCWIGINLGNVVRQVTIIRTSTSYWYFLCDKIRLSSHTRCIGTAMCPLFSGTFTIYTDLRDYVTFTAKTESSSKFYNQLRRVYFFFLSSYIYLRQSNMIYSHFYILSSIRTDLFTRKKRTLLHDLFYLQMLDNESFSTNIAIFACVHSF